MAQVEELQSSNLRQLKTFILKAWQLAGPSALGWTGATDENIKDIASDCFLQNLVNNTNVKVFVSKTGNKVIGFCVIRKIDCQTVELAGIIIHQEQQGKGVGSKLFETARKKAVDLGFSTMEVKTESMNKRALSFYKARKFVEQEQVVEELNNAKTNLTMLKLDLRET